MVSTTLSLLTTLLLAGVTSVRAHGHVVTWNVNGQDHAGFNPSWPPEYGPTANRPTDNRDQGWANQWTGIVACGGWGAGENVQTWDVQEGSTVTAVWDQWPHGHTGPVMEYMARCPDSGCDGVDAWTLNWFKISEAGWDGNSWPSDEITRTHRWSFQIPTGLAAGNYLVRHEIIAMHEVGAPQIYPVCFQANLAAGPGGVIPTDTVTFPDAYNQHDDFRRFNLYWGDDFNAFHNPGPAVWNGRGESGGSPAPSSAAPAPSSTGRGDSAPTAAPSASEGSSSEGGGGRGGGGRGGGRGGGGRGGGRGGNRGGNRGGDRGGDRWNNGNNDNQEEEWQPTRTLVTSNAMATGKRPSGEGGQKFCRRRQPAKRAAVPQLLSDEALAEREMAYAKRQHVANRYSKRSLRH